MRQEEHLVIDRTAPPLADVDWWENGWLGVRVASDHAVLLFDGREVVVDVAPQFPMVRRHPEAGAVLIDSRRQGATPNGWIVEPDGRMAESFDVGDAVQDLLVSRDHIVATYFDEGCFAGSPPSNGGVSIFDAHGVFQWGYSTSVGEFISDCYCASWHDTRTVGFLPYTSFDFVLLNVAEKTAETHKTPANLAGCGAVTTYRDTAWFHAPYNSNEILRWELGWTRVVSAGEHSGRLRGLPRGRFLAVGEQGFTVVTPEEME